MNIVTLPRPSYMPKLWPLPASCVLYLEGQQDAYSSTIKDLSGKGNDGTIYGAEWSRRGNGLRYLNFTGDDYVSCGSDTTLDISGAFTVKAWVYVATDDSGTVFSKQSQSTATGDGFWLRATATYARFYIFQADREQKIVTLNAFVADAWNHLVGTYNGSDEIEVSVNGVESGTPTAVVGFSPADAQNLILGRYSYLASTYLTGGIVLPECHTGAWSATQKKGSYDQERHLFGV